MYLLNKYIFVYILLWYASSILSDKVFADIATFFTYLLSSFSSITSSSVLFVLLLSSPRDLCLKDELLSLCKCGLTYSIDTKMLITSIPVNVVPLETYTTA